MNIKSRFLIYNKKDNGAMYDQSRSNKLQARPLANETLNVKQQSGKNSRQIQILISHLRGVPLITSKLQREFKSHLVIAARVFEAALHYLQLTQRGLDVLNRHRHVLATVVDARAPGNKKADMKRKCACDHILTIRSALRSKKSSRVSNTNKIFESTDFTWHTRVSNSFLPFENAQRTILPQMMN